MVARRLRIPLAVAREGKEPVVWFLAIAALIAAILMVSGGLLGSFVRVYASWSGDSLVTLAHGQDTVPSPIAPVAWLGHRPLTVRGATLKKGSRVEVKARTGEGRTPVWLLVDGRPQARFEVGARWRTYRLWLKRGGSRLQLDEPGARNVSIHIARIKITNVAGFMEGVLNAWIVRRGVAIGRSSWISRWALFLLLLATVILLAIWPDDRNRNACVPVRRCAGAVAVAAAILAAGWLLVGVLGFRLIVTPGTAAAILLAPGAATCCWEWIRRIPLPNVRSTVASRRVWESIAAVICILLWAAALIVLVQGRFGGDLRGVARFGWKFHRPSALAGVPELSRAGYDGQFYAALASDPLLREAATIRGLDNAGYRAGRILVPFLAWASAGGSPRLGPFAYVLWCWVLGLAGPALLLVWLRTSRWRLLWFAVLSINAGLVVSMLRATPDAAAFTLVLAALLLAERRAPLALTTAGGALAALARETSVLAVPGLAWPELKAKRWTRAIVLVAVPVTALGSWRLYVRAITHRGAGSAWANFGLPFGWVPEKIRRLMDAGWGHARLEWMGLAWVLLLVAAAGSYLIWRRRLTPVLMTFVLFSALAAALNIRVYSEVNAYARVLIALPFLAVILASDEERRWRRRVLIAGVVLASIQGAIVLHHEVSRAERAGRQRGEWREHMSRIGDLQVFGATIRPAAEWHLPPGRWVKLASVSGTTYATVGVLSGGLRVYRRERLVLSLRGGDAMTLPVRSGVRGVELAGEGPHGARLAPLIASSSAPSMPGHELLIPAVAGVDGFGGSRWTTTVTMRNETRQVQRIGLTLLPRARDRLPRVWAQVTLPAAGTLVLDDVVAALFGVRSAGAVLVACAEPPPTLRCRVGRWTRTGVSWVDVPVLSPGERARISKTPWSVGIPLAEGEKRAALILVNPTGRPTAANVSAAAGTKPVLDVRVRLGAWEVRQLKVPLGTDARELRISVSGVPGRIPVGVVSVTDLTTGAVELHDSARLGWVTPGRHADGEQSGRVVR
ncbi:MAG: hypothetical protein GXP48_02715 [Acidobacteria bacterium]|nr:hypothetical protein [Acidobacteriota bacterium]